MSFERISAGLNISEQIKQGLNKEHAIYNRETDSLSIHRAEAAKSIGRVVSRYALFGCEIDPEDVLKNDLPDLRDLELFEVQEKRVAEARIAMADKFDGQPADFAPLLVSRPSGEGCKCSMCSYGEFSSYDTSLVVADSRNEGLPYRNYFFRNKKLVLDDTKLFINGEVYDTAESMDNHTYRELLGHIGQSKGRAESRFDKNAFTALTAFGEDEEGRVVLATPQQIFSRYFTGDFGRARFRPSVTVDSTSHEAAETASL